MRRSLTIIGALAAGLSSAAAQVTAEQRVLREVQAVDASGRTIIREVPADLVAPGDRVVYRLSYRNDGAAPAAGLVLVMPVPNGISLVAGSPEGPGTVAYSLDGEAFAALDTLSVPGPAGARPATAADVRHVRWTLDAPLAPGASGEIAYRGVLN